jgi:pimeloyl-ACP methyl ester carboxylesterase
MKTTATLHDASTIEVEVAGEGPATLLLPVNPVPVEGEQAEAMRQWGADPALGRHLVDGLADLARVVPFDYEGHVLARPMPETLTPANLVADVLAVADAAGADRFAWYGYSWLGVAGLQLAVATDRLIGLALGGWPPIDAPYAEMLAVTRAGWELATGARTSLGEDEWADAYLQPDQQRQFVTLYEALAGFDDRAGVVGLPRGLPKLVLVGSEDQIEYGPTWGDVLVDLAAPVARNRAALETLGWEVHVLEGLDQTSAMQADVVLPILRAWVGRIGGVDAVS